MPHPNPNPNVGQSLTLTLTLILTLSLALSLTRYVGQSHAVQAQFATAEVQTHSGGHTVPNDAAAVARFGAFLDARLAELRPELVSLP